MDLKTEIKRNTLFNLMRYREYLINKLNEFSKIKFDESIKMMIFEVSYDLNKFSINIKCDVINQEDKKIENFFEGKEINEKIINNLRLFSPFHFNQIKEFDYEEAIKAEIIKWFGDCWSKSECVNLDKEIYIWGEDTAIIYKLKNGLEELKE